MIKFIYFAAMIMSTLEALSSPILIEDSAGVVNISQSSEYIEDAEGRFVIREIVSDRVENLWKKIDSDAPNFGVTESVFWFRFELENRKKGNKPVLEIAYPLLDSIEFFYLADDKRPVILKAGDHIPASISETSFDHRNPTFEMPLEEGQTRTFYMRIVSTGSLLVPFKIWDQRALSNSLPLQYLGFGIYYGLGLVMMIYNLILLVTVRDRNYLYYSIYIMTLLLSQMGLHGLSSHFLWPDQPSWSNISLPFFMIATTLTLVVFSMSFLKTRSLTPKLHRLATLLVGVQSVGMVLAFVIPYRSVIYYAAAMVTLTAITLVLCTIQSLRIGYRPARFYFLAFIMLIVGGVVTVLKGLGLIPSNFFTEYAIQIGSTFEIILLSLALGDKIHEEQMESQRKIDRLNTDLIKLNGDLVEKDRARTLFFHNTSHELRTPLNGIIGIADLLNRGTYGPLQVSVSEAIGKMQSLAVDLKDLVNHILLLARDDKKGTRINIAPFSIKKLEERIKAISSGLEAKYPESYLVIESDLPEDDMFISDEEKVTTITKNLVANALKFRRIGEKNRVLLKIDCTSDKPDCLEITVMDQGIGIPKEEIERIFDEFKQVQSDVSRLYEGTGLGLSLTKSLVESLGGSISVTSEPGASSTFKVSLPSHALEMEKGDFGEEIGLTLKQADVKMADSLIGNQANDRMLSPVGPIIQDHANDDPSCILIVDDNKTNVEIMDALLSHHGYKTQVAYGGKQAMLSIQENPPDLILLDLMMPEVSGEDVLKWVQSNPNTFSIPVMILTARASEEDRIITLSQGADDYIAKPIVSSEVLFRVKNLLRRVNQAEQQGKVQQLLESDKLISLGTMAAGIAHEIKNPLAIISGSANLALTVLEEQEDLQIDPLIEENLERILEVVDRIARIISGLHTYSRDARGDPFQRVPLVSCINETIALCMSRLKSRGVNLKFDPGRECYVKGRATQISQVVFNLITNAVDAIEEQSEPWISIEILESDSEVEIRITDSGHGIPPDVAGQIFNPFYTSKEVGKGTGLGLAISQRLISDHSGALTVDHSVQNTCFSIRLPKEAYGPAEVELAS